MVGGWCEYWMDSINVEVMGDHTQAVTYLVSAAAPGSNTGQVIGDLMKVPDDCEIMQVHGGWR